MNRAKSRRLKRLKTKTWQWRQGRHIHRDDESVFSLCPFIKGYNTAQGPQGSTTNNSGSTCILRPHPAFSSLESIEPKVIGYFLYGLVDVSLLIRNSSSAEKTRWTLTRTTLLCAWLVKNPVMSVWTNDYEGTLTLESVIPYCAEARLPHLVSALTLSRA